MEEQQDSSTATKAQCTECGTEVPPDAPLGLCPACLLKRAMLATTAGLNRPSAGGAFEPPSVAELTPLFPQLEIIELIGRGGMGAVYKARQIHLDRFVAIKILPTTIADDPAFAERFAREARSLARLNHANIVTVHDFGRAGPYFYFVMEYVDGANLRQALLTKSLEPQQALAIVPQICDALQYAHDEGIVHRDIKPENVLLDKKGRVKIADFGLAKLLQKTPQNYTLTQTHVTMGTPQYMAPEQTERPTEVDHRADIYSLGVVFYEMLTGELPLGRFAAPSQKAPVDARLDDVVFKTLEKEPARRYQHASEVKTSVQELSSAPTRPTAPASQPGASTANDRDAQTVLPYAPPANVPTSRTAVIGAIFGALGLGALALMVMAVGVLGSSGRVAGVIVLPLVVFALGCFIVMTACGLFAIGQIRRSNGQIGGLRLALFDAVAPPMLIVIAVVMMVFSMLLYLGISPLEAIILFAVLVFPLCVLGGFFIVRYLWRRVCAGTPDAAPTRRPEKPKPAMSGITYQGPGRFSRTAIVGAAWGSLALLGPACLLVGSVAIPGIRAGAPGSNSIVVTGKKFTVTPPPTPPKAPKAPVAPLAPRVPAAVQELRPTTRSVTITSGSGGIIIDTKPGTHRDGRGRPTTQPNTLGAATTRPAPALDSDLSKTFEDLFEKRFELELAEITTGASPTTVPFVTIDPLAIVSGRDANGTITYGSASSGGGGFGGGFGGTISTRSGSSSSSSSPFAPVFVTPPAGNARSFWSSVNEVARGMVFPVLALAISAPIGATILGIIAISQIRRSNGALYGMPLAVADALFLPLLIVDGLIVAIVVGLFAANAAKHPTPGSDAMLAPLSAAAVAVALVLDWWIWRRAVRAAEAP